jgi:hypothetical protein
VPDLSPSIRRLASDIGCDDVELGDSAWRFGRERRRPRFMQVIEFALSLALQTCTSSMTSGS